MSSSDLTQLYPGVILAHYRNPEHAHLPECATHRAAGDNPLCGDHVVVGLEIRNGRLRTVGHETHGCALCVASASLMCKALSGAQLTTVQTLNEHFRALVTGHTTRVDTLGPLGAFCGVAEVPMRHACALLPWDVLISALG